MHGIQNYEIIHICFLTCHDDLITCGIRFAITDVIFNGSGKQTNLAMEMVHMESFDVGPIELDVAGNRAVKSV